MKTPSNSAPLTVCLERFSAHWAIIDRATSTLKEYKRYLNQLFTAVPTPTVLDAETWLAAETSVSVRRMKGRAIRAIGKWLTKSGDTRLSWWVLIPLAKEIEKEQPTVTRAEYLEIRAIDLPSLVRLIVELLWSTGVRRGELAALLTKDVNLDNRTILVRKTKNDEPRYVPINDEAAVELERHLQTHRGSLLIGQSSEAIRKLLRRWNLPSSHAWRRGWAVDSLTLGMNEVNVRTAGGWRSGAMVARYTKKHKQQVAMAQFRQLRSSTKRDDPA